MWRLPLSEFHGDHFFAPEALQGADNALKHCTAIGHSASTRHALLHAAAARNPTWARPHTHPFPLKERFVARGVRSRRAERWGRGATTIDVYGLDHTSKYTLVDRLEAKALVSKKVLPDLFFSNSRGRWPGTHWTSYATEE